MKINTLRFGDIDVQPEELITFPEGLLGFAQIKSFAILESADIAPFFWFQAIEDPSVSFVIVDPLLIYPEYQAQVLSEDIAGLELENPSDAKVLAVCVVPSDPRDSTINLKGPLVINPHTGRGKQVVLSDPRYETRHPIWRDNPTQEDKSCSS